MCNLEPQASALIACSGLFICWLVSCFYSSYPELLLLYKATKHSHSLSRDFASGFTFCSQMPNLSGCWCLLFLPSLQGKERSISLPRVVIPLFSWAADLSSCPHPYRLLSQSLLSIRMFFFDSLAHIQLLSYFFLSDVANHLFYFTLPIDYLGCISSPL